jgi:mannose-6-phosphate isomerase
LSGCYPLVFKPLLFSKVWGGDRLARFGKDVARGSTIGESWEVADLASTASSGAGGGAQRSVITNGAMAGSTLHEAMLAWPAAMLGPKHSSARTFPLLVKFLDAKQNLSVQVHPSPAYARTHADAHLKTEAWFIMDAAPGSVIYKGVKQGVTRDLFQRAIAAGKVAECLISVPARVGDCHNLPSGTCHALGAGVLVAEVQTPSDTTFRVFDWGRPGRELHIAPSLDCIHWGKAPEAVPLVNPSGGFGATLTTEFFVLRHLSLTNSSRQRIPGDDACTILMVLNGAGSLQGQGGAFPAMPLKAGMTVLVPAELASATTIIGEEMGGMECLIAQLP